MKPRPCDLCGNPVDPEQNFPVQCNGGYAEVCYRCSGVILDRTHNATRGKPLLTRQLLEETIWKVPVP